MDYCDDFMILYVKYIKILIYKIYIYNLIKYTYLFVCLFVYKVLSSRRGVEGMTVTVC